jgi:hypothetical protein
MREREPQIVEVRSGCSVDDIADEDGEEVRGLERERIWCGSREDENEAVEN